ncbi:B12-binding domain-containing radical SAM protein [Acuticoccus sp. MNP-M23]|uniref:B12-binding domain-containing radical SAM protein n=1 Tax=Acuticoccus sp. MNP-M23 TaxID=3072793 RepID=UPI0028167B30|nr:B12-binding domain-containing radical SAM protein [Acuticoccus sp. MNP-M23]WMS42776.1 B12-binding domain-containing radical SAM protein [Acuticoccus sp. MNP-M23]
MSVVDAQIGAIQAPAGLVPRLDPPKVLMVHPLFMAGSFWSFETTSQMYGAEYPMPPLGLATVAAMLPPEWDVRIMDRNIEEVTEADILAVDLVMTGGMLPQRIDLMHMIDWAQSLGKKVCVGGPDIMSTPSAYEHVDFLVVGEAESVIDQFIEAWRAGSEGARFDAEKFKADVTASPIPRFDLLNRPKYLQMTVQYSRGCPFMCEFCDIIELFGRKPRTKTNEQILEELQAIYDLGYRGHVNFVDDNLIGNKKAIKGFLPHLIKWQEDHGNPFDFSTEASLNLADDSDLMTMMSKAGFLGVFIGIESPDPDVLKATQKKQNTKRDIAQSVHRVYEHGMSVLAGFIVGFDEEKGAVGDAVADLIEEAAIPVAMVGLLYALPETQLSRRLEKEGRMYPQMSFEDATRFGTVDQCTLGLNFDTQRPREEILKDFRTVVARSYTPEAYHKRVRRMTDLMKFEHANLDSMRSGVVKNLVFVVRLCWALGIVAKDGKRLYWGTLLHGLKKGSAAFDAVFLSLAAYAHLGPFSKTVLKAIDARIEEGRSGRDAAAATASVPVLAAE